MYTLFWCKPVVHAIIALSLTITLFCVTERKRAVYDQFGEEGLKNGVPSGTIESGAWTSGYTFHGNADKVFRDFFGGDNPFQGNLYM